MCVGVTAVNVTDSEEQRALCPLFTYQFVCGVDNMTYDNACLLARAGVEQASRGACKGFPVPKSAGGCTKLCIHGSHVSCTANMTKFVFLAARRRTVIITLCVLGSALLMAAGALVLWRRRMQCVWVSNTCLALMTYTIRARAGCIGNLQLCANPTYNPYRVVQAGALKTKARNGDMEANQGHSSEGEIPAVRHVPDAQPLVGPSRPRSARDPRWGGAEVALSAVRRRTSSRSIE